jgi:hypothetical protein
MKESKESESKDAKLPQKSKESREGGRVVLLIASTIPRNSLDTSNVLCLDVLCLSNHLNLLEHHLRHRCRLTLPSYVRQRRHQGPRGCRRSRLLAQSTETEEAVERRSSATRRISVGRDRGGGLQRGERGRGGRSLQRRRGGRGRRLGEGG